MLLTMKWFDLSMTRPHHHYVRSPINPKFRQIRVPLDSIQKKKKNRSIDSMKILTISDPAFKIKKERFSYMFNRNNWGTTQNNKKWLLVLKTMTIWCLAISFQCFLRAVMQLLHVHPYGQMLTKTRDLELYHLSLPNINAGLSIPSHMGA